MDFKYVCYNEGVPVLKILLDSNISSFAVSWNDNYLICITTETNHSIFNSLHKEMVVLYINESVCGSCVRELLSYMAQLGDLIGKDKLLLLGNFKNEIDFKKYANDATVFVENSLFCNDINFLKGIDKQPVVFIIDKNYEIRLFYVPNYYPDFKETYFTNILPSYFLCKDYER